MQRGPGVAVGVVPEQPGVALLGPDESGLSGGSVHGVHHQVGVADPDAAGLDTSPDETADVVLAPAGEVGVPAEDGRVRPDAPQVTPGIRAHAAQPEDAAVGVRHGPRELRHRPGAGVETQAVGEGSHQVVRTGDALVEAQAEDLEVLAADLCQPRRLAGPSLAAEQERPAPPAVTPGGETLVEVLQPGEVGTPRWPRWTASRVSRTDTSGQPAAGPSTPSSAHSSSSTSAHGAAVSARDRGRRCTASNRRLDAP